MYGQRQQRKPQEIFKVYWLGKDPSVMYQKDFTDPKKAQEFTKEVKNSMAFHLEQHNPKKQSSKLKLMPSEDSEEFLRSVELHRKLSSKKGFANMDGIAEVAVSTTTEYQKSQKIRLLDVFVLAPLIFYGGYRLLQHQKGSEQPATQVSVAETSEGDVVETQVPEAAPQPSSSAMGGIGDFINKALPYALMAIGVATLYYNGKNYMVNKKAEVKKK